MPPAAFPKRQQPTVPAFKILPTQERARFKPLSAIKPVPEVMPSPLGSQRFQLPEPITGQTKR